MVLFIDLRDRTGITQVVFNAERNAAVHKAAHTLRSECVVSVTGQVMARPDESKNPNLPTGEIEVFVDAVEILNEAKTPPFVIEDDAERQRLTKEIGNLVEADARPSQWPAYQALTNWHEHLVLAGSGPAPNNHADAAATPLTPVAAAALSGNGAGTPAPAGVRTLIAPPRQPARPAHTLWK